MINNVLRSKLFLVFIFILAVVLQYKFLQDQTFTPNVINTIVTFLSVLFGFYITSLAIFVTSQYVRELYKTTDKNHKERTLLHTLLSNYKFGLVVNLFSIIYFIVLGLFFGNGDTFRMGDKPYILIIALLAVNFLYHYLMLSDLIKIIVQESKSS